MWVKRLITSCLYRLVRRMIPKDLRKYRMPLWEITHDRPTEARPAAESEHSR